ncbi:MAG: AIPR family protein [Candidatus Cohnella colombiensis]|uniref:AIPR family protein n=1 Tax=Candidatus Cohnella colombiensis TaxID=3121368 RepID=A0AA95EWT7_9BACL|nr:MAG: AIPR family protein [Cohnella sp.]
MAKNDVILLDGILEERVNEKIPSTLKDEAFEFLATEQILKDFDLSADEILNGSVDGRNDGGIDGFYIIVNGHLLTETDSFFWPKANAELEVHIITCKHHDTFKQQTLDSLIASLTELFDFGITEKDLKGDYNNDLLEMRKDFIFAYKKLSSTLARFNIKLSYGSRGDTNNIGENISARARQIESICKNCFSSCSVSFQFWGCTELLNAYRKIKKYGLDLSFQESLSQGEQYVVLTKIDDYYKFLTDEEQKLRMYLFDSNVRDYMGLNPVNGDILNTLKSTESPNFWWLNNGITILATSANIVGKTIHIENVQIVNGLQTSESIYRYFTGVGSDYTDRCVLVKIIVTNSVEVRDEIIRATNNQTEVALASLHATDKIQRDIEDILYSDGLYYERRINYYLNQGVPKSSIFNPLYLASAFVNLILKQPHKAVSLKNKFMRNDKNYALVFSEKTNLKVWPVLARIMRATDFELENLRPKKSTSNDNFLKSTRQLTAFITVARLIGTFNFSINDLIMFDLAKYEAVEIKKTWELISESLEAHWQKKLWRQKDFTSNLCLLAAKKNGIKDYEAFYKRKDPMNEFEPKPRLARKKVLDEEFITLINSLLPPQPWKPGIHYRIARDINRHPALVSRAIQVLIKQGVRHKQVDGIVYDQDGRVLSFDSERVDPIVLERSMSLKLERLD